MKFWKMQALGNDFLVLDTLTQSVDLSPKRIGQLADRHFGVGCDQVLVIEKARDSQSDFFYRIFNADGQEVGQCGNGARCVARYIHDKGLSQKTRLHLETSTTRLGVQLKEGGRYEVNMGIPSLDPKRVPYDPKKLIDGKLLTSEGEMTFFCVSMGNPHAVTIVPEVSTVPVDALGKWVSEHEAFPERTNVIFMELFNPGWIKCRIYERGVGETLACGSGACAAVFSGIQQSLLNDDVLVDLPGGRLEVQEKQGAIYLIGPAEKVFEGEI